MDGKWFLEVVTPIFRKILSPQCGTGDGFCAGLDEACLDILCDHVLFWWGVGLGLQPVHGFCAPSWGDSPLAVMLHIMIRLIIHHTRLPEAVENDTSDTSISCLITCKVLQCASSFPAASVSIGENVKLLIDRPDGLYCFRLHKDRVYYVKEEIMRKATNIGRQNLLSLGTCFGKFTKSQKFKLQVTALDFLAPYAKHKVWVKPGAEQSFLYGNHILKSGLGRITDNTPQYQGVVVYSMSDVALGFGATARSTQQCRHADPADIVCFHQADIGEYLRNEDTLT